MPAVFAVADKAIQDPQTATFAAFGSFAMLVLADFGGSLRARFVAYVTLACAGAAFVVLGTLCARNAWLAAAAMAAAASQAFREQRVPRTTKSAPPEARVT